MSYDDSEAEKLSKRSGKAFPRGYKGATRTKTEFFFPTGIRNTSTVGIRETGSGGQWLLRADTAHRGTPHAHININPQRFGRPDPHLRIPEGAPQVFRGGAKVLHTVNKVATPAALIVDAATVAYNAKKDIDNGTSRNSVTNLAGIAGGWTGAFAGAELGVCVGAAGGPVGALVGAIVGGIVGGIGGGVGAETAADGIGDALEYDMEIRECQGCGCEFMARSYLGQVLCEACQN